MPYEEEEDRGCEVKCPKGGGVCDNGATAILLLLRKAECDLFLKDCLNNGRTNLAFQPALGEGNTRLFRNFALHLGDAQGALPGKTNSRDFHRN